jgi:deoxyribose-phosphate aldolase
MIPPIKLPVPIINRIFIIKTTLQRLYGTNVLLLHIIKNTKKMTTISQLAKMIDHSILHPTLTDADLKKECAVAIKYNVASVCVKPYMVPMAKKLLKGFDVLVGCVIGFPAGNSTIASKVFETEDACKNGAVEIDMVINIGKALQGDWDYVENEIEAVTMTCHKHGAIVKVIFETDFVTKEADIIKLCQICTKVKADYVKTSTGYGFVKGVDGKYDYQGATIPNLKLMRQHCGPEVKVKAAGGVHTLEQLIAVREAGCDRCGASATAAIMEEAEKRFGM